MSPDIFNRSLSTAGTESVLGNATLKSHEYHDTTGVYNAVLTVYIVVAVILIVCGVGGCIIVCLCGRPRVTPGRVHNLPGLHQQQQVVFPVAPTAVPQATGSYQTAFQNPNFDPTPSEYEKGVAPPCYNEAVNPSFVNPVYR